MKKPIIIMVAIITLALTVAPAAAITRGQHQKVMDFVKNSKTYLPMQVQRGVCVEKIKKETQNVWLWEKEKDAIVRIRYSWQHDARRA